MARTWNLEATLDLGRGPIPPFDYYQVGVATRVIENGDYSAIYFSEGTTSKYGDKIWEWDGASLLDIAGDFFELQTGTVAGGTAFIAGLCWFEDELYAAYSVGLYPADEGRIARWNGATGSNAWSDIYTFKDESDGDVIYQDYGWGSQWSKRRFCLDCDGARMATIGHRGTKNRMAASPDAESWTLQNTEGSYSDPLPYLVGRYQGSNYGKVVTVEGYPGSLGRAIKPNEADNWAYLTGSTGTHSVLIGYGDGKSFWMVDQGGGNWELESSDDWGESFTNANGPTIGDPPAQILKRFNDSDILFCEQGDTQVYAWDSDALEVVTDGTTGHSVWGFFRLNGDLCALCGVGGSGEAQIYCAGPVDEDAAEFYHGAASLDFKVNLGFRGVNPGAMAIRDKLDTVVFGSDEAGEEMGNYSLYPYGAASNMTEGIPTGTPVSSVEWV